MSKSEYERRNMEGCKLLRSTLHQAFYESFQLSYQILMSNYHHHPKLVYPKLILLHQPVLGGVVGARASANLDKAYSNLSKAKEYKEEMDAAS